MFSKKRVLSTVNLVFVFLTLACKKETTAPAKTPARLLTGKQWVLFAGGFDDNQNGIVDKNEDVLRDCDRDNTLNFAIDGTGKTNDNRLLCGGVQENNFIWKLSNDGKELTIDQTPINILELNEKNLRYIPKLDGLETPFVIEYRR